MKLAGLKKTGLLLLTGLILVAFSAAPLFSQQINADVKLMLDRLPLEKQQKLQYFSEMIQDYINTHSWTDDQFDDPINVTIQIFLQDKSTSYESRYGANFLITNNVDLQRFDKYWKFSYNDGDPLLHDENVFNSFTSFVNFYMYIVLGSEYDKMGKYLGTPYFQKSKQICEQAKFNSLYSYGWEERELKIDEILSDDNLPFRSMKDLLFLGYSYIGEADSVARRYCGDAVKILDDILTDDPKNEQALDFLQAHYIDIMNLFKDDDHILRIFMRIDPAHAETYEKYLKK